MMKPALLQKTSLQQTLTPQQIQYLKLLQMPIISLEQTVRQEVEENPFLEEISDIDDFAAHDIDAPAPDQVFSDNNFDELEITQKPDKSHNSNSEDYNGNDNYSNENYNNSDNFYSEDANRDVFTDDLKINNLEKDDSYDYYNYQWEDDGDFSPKTADDNDFEPFQIKDETSVADDLLNQIRLLSLKDEEKLLANYIIGNIDEDGYLRISLEEIVNETNSIIAEHNFTIQKKLYEQAVNPTVKNDDENPAKKFELSAQSIEMLKSTVDDFPELQKNISSSGRLLEKLQISNSEDKIFSHLDMKTAEKILNTIQHLEPVGIASRNIQECLIAQLEAKNNEAKKKNNINEAQELALLILKEGFDEFSKKHFQKLQKKFEISAEQIREAFEEIKRLNPKPGGNDFISQTNTIIPDFTVRFDSDVDDLIVNINNTTIPNLQVSPTYDKIRQEARHNKNFNKNTKEWIKDKYENARFFIQAIKQRNITMLMVMTSIVQRQREFFLNDSKSIKPMIYKDIADDTSLDISTVCRIVNSKYVLTKMGTFELKYFFSEALPNDAGEDISTTVIKDKIKDIIALEPKLKPFSDEYLCKALKEEGYNVARRTIAKYREMLKIPVARLRKEI